MESMYTKYMDSMGSAFGASPVSKEEENKFSIKVADCSISNKINQKPQKPSLSYFEITLNKDAELAFLAYIVFQNFYTSTITIKQFVPLQGGIASVSKEDLKNEKQWVTILKDYQLMHNAHFENDAQNYHIVGIEMVSPRS